MSLVIKTRRATLLRNLLAYGIPGLALLAVLALGVAAYLQSTAIGPGWRGVTGYSAAQEHFANPVEQRAVLQLRDFNDWLSRSHAKGYIGEVGWPGSTAPEDPHTHEADGSTNSQAWNAVADAWYHEADRRGLWVTAWSAGSWWYTYPLSIYDSSDSHPGLRQARTQSGIIERHRTTKGTLRGVNLAGMEFGTDAPGFSNTKPGTPGQSYFYEPAASYTYLAGRGVKLVRLPFSWERVQPALGGPLNPAEVKAITAQLNAAQANGIRVVLDLHNYGAYTTATGRHPLGDGTLTQQHLADVWHRLSAAFKDHPAVAGYGIMNEPHDLPKSDFASPAKNWEAASQTVVNDLRANGDKTLLMVAGYDWSSLAHWGTNHPSGWIHDPAHNFRYEAHHYWDSDGSGRYVLPFTQEIQQQNNNDQTSSSFPMHSQNRLQ